MGEPGEGAGIPQGRGERVSLLSWPAALGAPLALSLEFPIPRSPTFVSLRVCLVAVGQGSLKSRSQLLRCKLRI